MHKIILHRNTVKFYRKADDALQERVTDAIDVIARNPHMDGHIKKLKKEEAFNRIGTPVGRNE